VSADARLAPRSPYQLRNHLTYDHHLLTRGLAWAELVAVHDQEHSAVTPGHAHETGPR
jgi:hypothetical protein